MAFKGLHFAGREWRNITASKVMWVVIAAIAVMPLLYGALYLAAFQDPYARLNTVPVAVVNEDKGAVIAAENRTLGNDVVEELKTTTEGLQWNFVSAEEAQRGLENGTYYMTCTIPSDFSQSVASVDTGAPEKAQLKVVYNQSANMLASQIGQTVWDKVRTSVSNTIADQYWTTVLDRVSSSGSDIRTAAEGAGKLSSGLVTAQDGSLVMASNLGTLKDGAMLLDGGLGTLSSGTFTLQNATRSLVAGAGQLKEGASQVAGGAGSVASGASQLQSDGTSALAGGASQLAQAAGELPSRAAQLATGSEALSGGLDQAITALGRADSPSTLIGGQTELTAGLSLLEYGLDGAPGLADAQKSMEGITAGVEAALTTTDAAENTTSNSTRAIKEALVLLSGSAPTEKDLDDAIDLLTTAQRQNGFTAEALSDIKGSASGGSGLLYAQAISSEVALGLGVANTALSEALIPGASQVLVGLGQLKGDASQGTGLSYAAVGAAQLAAGTAQLSDTAPTLVSSIKQIDAGAAQVNAKMSDLSSGAYRVASGASQVNDGASSAASGASRLNEGATQLTAGANTAKSGAAQLASGAGQLQEGASSLAVGLGGAVEGSGELASRLSEGANTAAEQTTNTPVKAKVMSSPVELVDDYYTTVKNYGTGFAPYFMALGLWVGGLVAGFVFKPLNNRLVMSGGNPLTVAFANYLPVAFFSLIQATLLMVVLQFGLQLQIDNIPAFYAMGYLTALVFAAIMQFLMAAFGFPGKFLAIILLMLQLTACAGTFPIQTTPDFFQAINPYMPMTYVVEALRQIMAGLDYSLVLVDCEVLLVVGLVCFALTCLVAYRRRTVRMEDIHPILQLG